MTLPYSTRDKLTVRTGPPGLSYSLGPTEKPSETAPLYTEAKTDANEPRRRPSSRDRVARSPGQGRSHGADEDKTWGGHSDIPPTEDEFNSIKRWFSRLGSRELHQFPSEFKVIDEMILRINEQHNLMSKARFCHLPHELLERTLRFLDAASLARCARSCRQLRDMTDDVAKLACAQADYKPLGGTLSWKAMLRAHEMITGVPGPIVPIPCVSLRSLVKVENAGKSEVNGIYVNNEISANGHVFARKANGKMYTICKMFSGAQLYWYMRENDVPMYWAALTLEGAGRPYGFPPRDWNAFENHQSPAPRVYIENASSLPENPGRSAKKKPPINKNPSTTATTPYPTKSTIRT